MTKNQIFIYFLIPIFLALLETDIKTFKINYKKNLSIILIFIFYFYNFEISLEI